jgi:hypothetical protein
MLMVNPEKMIRSDGTKVTLPRHPSWKAEIMGLYYVLKDDPLILLLFPMFFASNWFTTWRQSPPRQYFSTSLTQHLRIQ